MSGIFTMCNTQFIEMLRVLHLMNNLIIVICTSRRPGLCTACEWSKPLPSVYFLTLVISLSKHMQWKLQRSSEIPLSVYRSRSLCSSSNYSIVLSLAIMRALTPNVSFQFFFYGDMKHKKALTIRSNVSFTSQIQKTFMKPPFYSR